MLVLINLESAVERRDHMAAQLATLALRFERIGIDGRARPREEIDAWARERFGGIEFDHDLLSGAEVGCWLSHLCAWDLLRHRRDLRACTVIEDDLVLDPQFAHVVAALERGSVHDVTYLGTSSRSISSQRRMRAGGCWLHEPIGTVLNTWGYVITRAYVERFFAVGNLRLRVPIDHFLGSRGARAAPRIAVLRPPVVREDPALGARSQIGPHTHRLDRWQLVERTRRRLLASRVGDMYYSLYRWL